MLHAAPSLDPIQHVPGVSASASCSAFSVNLCGCTRIVILTRRHAFKLPNFLSGWRLFLTGLLCNMQERTFAQTGWPELCPVQFSIPGGWLVVMHRVREMTDEEFLNFDSKAWADRGTHLIPCEHKSNSFGWLDGRPVCIDYGS
jgi:hypothetical protein